MGVKIKVEGVTELQKKLLDAAKPGALEKVVRQNGAEMQQRMQREAVFTRGYSTGATQQSISLQITDGGNTAEVGPETEYSEYIERGTRFMEPQPFVTPALDVQKNIFLRDIDRLIKSRLK